MDININIVIDGEIKKALLEIAGAACELAGKEPLAAPKENTDHVLDAQVYAAALAEKPSSKLNEEPPAEDLKELSVDQLRARAKEKGVDLKGCRTKAAILSKMGAPLDTEPEGPAPVTPTPVAITPAPVAITPAPVAITPAPVTPAKGEPTLGVRDVRLKVREYLDKHNGQQDKVVALLGSCGAENVTGLKPEAYNSFLAMLAEL